MYGNHKKVALFVGSETECEKYILKMCKDSIYRVLHMPDGNVYDIGQSIMYQIVDAADGEVGIDNPVDETEETLYWAKPQ